MIDCIYTINERNGTKVTACNSVSSIIFPRGAKLHMKYVYLITTCPRVVSHDASNQVD